MKLQKIIASGLGTGFSPFAPGTAGAFLGTIVTYFFNYAMSSYLDLPAYLVLISNIISTVIIMFIGVWAIKYVHSEWIHDANEIVIDEIVGVAIALIAAPLDWRVYLVGFLLFRFFDILKPLGIREIDMKDGDWSVMLDDVLAGVYAFVIVQLIVFYL